MNFGINSQAHRLFEIIRHLSGYVGIFRRWDTACYKDGSFGFIPGFGGKSACRIVDIYGNYIKNPEKNYTQVSLKDVQLIHRNQGRVPQILPIRINLTEFSEKTVLKRKRTKAGKPDNRKKTASQVVWLSLFR